MKQKGWGPVELSTASGVDVSLIRRYLDDVDIGQKNAPRLAKVLDVEVMSLLYGEQAA